MCVKCLEEDRWHPNPVWKDNLCSEHNPELPQELLGKTYGYNRETRRKFMKPKKKVRI